MLAASGIAASVTHRPASHTCCSSTSRCDGGRVKAPQQEMVALPPSRRLKDWQQQGVSSAWTTVLAAVSGLLRVQEALGEEDESVITDAARAYARLTAGPQAPEADDSFNIQLPELNLELPQLDFKVPEFQAPEVDLSGIGGAFSGAADLVAENPVAVVGGIALVAIPLLVARFLGRKADPYGTVTAEVAYEKLSDADLNAELVDIRPEEDIKTEGTPDLRALKKRVFQVACKVEQEEEAVAAAAAAVVEKLKAKVKKPQETTLYVVDRFDGNSLAVAKLATDNGFLAAYAVKGGAEGPNGWRLSELPWLAPKKGFTLDLSTLLDSTFGSDNSVVPAAVGVAAAAAAGVVVFSEAETALQLLGSAALFQLFVKKFLFAKDREQTFKQIKELLDTKVAPKTLVDDMKSIGQSLASTAEQFSAQVLGPPAAASVVNGVAAYEIEAPKTLETEAGDGAGATTLISAEVVAETEVEAAAPEPAPPVDAAVQHPAPPLDAKPDPVAVGSTSSGE